MITNIYGAARTAFLNTLPGPVLKSIEERLKNEDLKGYIQGIRLRKYAQGMSKAVFDLRAMPTCAIEDGEFDYPLFQVCFLENMVALCVLCLADGRLPVIQYKNSDDEYLWERFLEQPFGEAAECDSVLEAKTAALKIPAFPTKGDIRLFHDIYERLVKPNIHTKQYLEEELRQLFSPDERILGVLVRGTDYTANRPKWHPVQPELDEVIQLCREKIQELRFTRIYLATEEKRVSDRFSAEFPGMIIVNKRKYFDYFYDLYSEKHENARISQVHFDRENDSYYKSLEYLSSLNLLSKCSGLIAGSTGGSRFALVMNNNRYEYVHLFNKGYY